MKKGVSLVLATILTVGLLTACSSKKEMNDKNMPGMDHSNMQMNNDKK